jgi:hypothetical protein
MIKASGLSGSTEMSRWGSGATALIRSYIVISGGNHRFGFGSQAHRRVEQHLTHSGGDQEVATLTLITYYQSNLGIGSVVSI